MKNIRFKAAVSTLLILMIIFLAFTGTLLYFGKTGMICGISRGVLRQIHFWAAAFICVLIIVHLVMNRRLYLAGLRARRIRNSELEIRNSGTGETHGSASAIRSVTGLENAGKHDTEGES